MFSTQPRILLAEDSVVLGEVLRFNLERAGFYVAWAPNGKAAVDMLRHASFDLFVTDYEMPILNGEEACSAVRNELRLTDLPIVMCSAKGLELDFDQLASMYGVRRLLQKPFSISELIILLRELLPESIRTQNESFSFL